VPSNPSKNKGKMSCISKTSRHCQVSDSSSDDSELAAEIRTIAPGGVDVVYEFVGRATFDASFAAVKDGGLIVNIGAASGPPEIDNASLAARRIRLVGAAMAARTQCLPSRKAIFRQEWTKRC